MKKHFIFAVNLSALACFTYLVLKLAPVHFFSFVEKHPLDANIGILTTIALIVVIYMLIDWLREQVVKLIK